MASSGSGGDKAVPFVLGLVVGIIVTAVVGGGIYLATRSSGGSTPAAASSSPAPVPTPSGTSTSTAPPINPDQVQLALTSLGLDKCTQTPAPTQGKTFTAINVICASSKDDTARVSVAIVTKNWEGARADLCSDVKADPTTQNIQIVSDFANFVAIGGTGLLQWPNPPTVEQVASVVGGKIVTIPQFCTA